MQIKLLMAQVLVYRAAPVRRGFFTIVHCSSIFYCRWEFKTEGYDIGFGVSLLNSSEQKEIIPMERVNSHFVPEDGALVCARIGTCKLFLDSSLFTKIYIISISETELDLRLLHVKSHCKLKVKMLRV